MTSFLQTIVVHVQYYIVGNKAFAGSCWRRVQKTGDI